MMKKNKIPPIFFASIAIMLFFISIHSCKKKEFEPPANPYDSVDYGTPKTNTPPDPNSIAGIHANILKPRCAVPGCHDGNFEPDFRSVQSSFATLVYHPVKKNSPDSAFMFRVVPYNTAKSVLYERITNCCFVNQDDRMPQDNIGVPLQQDKIDNIANWIMGGAKDMFGQVPTYPNTEPRILYYVALDSVFQVELSATNNRIDSIPYNPFLLPSNKKVFVAVFLQDDSTSMQNMQVNQLKMSLDKDDFSSGWSYTASYFTASGQEFFLANFNTSSFPKNQIIYMRYYVNDGDHANNTYFPTENLIDPYKTYWSFYVY
jgi:hypothetical protein